MLSDEYTFVDALKDGYFDSFHVLVYNYTSALCNARVVKTFSPLENTNSKPTKVISNCALTTSIRKNKKPTPYPVHRSSEEDVHTIQAVAQQQSDTQGMLG